MAVAAAPRARTRRRWLWLAIAAIDRSWRLRAALGLAPRDSDFR
jgi:hypothetical protein